MQVPVTVVILAAGLGTRMKSRHAKVLHRAGGRALIEHVVRTSLEIAAADCIYVVVGHQADRVRDAVRVPGVGFVLQREQKGTGHALMVAREQLVGLEGPLVILYGDCPRVTAATLRRLIDAQHGSGAAGAILTALMDDPTGYGRILRDAQGNVTGVVEQKAGTPEQLAIREANMGLYCFQAAVFWKHVMEIQPNNPAREYYLTDMPEILARAGHGVQTVRIEDYSEVLGINTRAELAQIDRLFRERKAAELMREGVTIERPETVTIDPGVAIGMDTVVEAFAQVLGNTVIGDNCRIGAASILQDAQLADDVEVGPFTFIGTSRIGRGARIGPYARLRMENEVREGAQVGNFVELKKTTLGRRAKAMHLAYLGDSVIGAGVNVGAGTITCNYDGRRKHQTRIGDGAFIGSNSTLVAPLSVGEGAYVGAGSVITDSVPADALALGRSRQVLKEGWAKQRRGADNRE